MGFAEGTAGSGFDVYISALGGLDAENAVESLGSESLLIAFGEVLVGDGRPSQVVGAFQRGDLAGASRSTISLT